MMNSIMLANVRNRAFSIVSSRLSHCWLILVGAAATFVSAQAQLAAPTYVSGSAQATITINFHDWPPENSTVACSLSLSSNDARGPADTLSTTAPVTGNQAICYITIYYRWRLTVPSADTMTISYSATGPIQTSSGVVNIIPMPADGAFTGPMNIVVTQSGY